MDDVWKVLDKSKYTEEGVLEMENVYLQLVALGMNAGRDSIEQLLNNWNNHSSETFLLLQSLVAKE